MRDDAGMPGFVAYSSIRAGDGGLSVTLCQDKAGTDVSVRVAADWIRRNVAASTNPPEISEGDVILQLS